MANQIDCPRCSGSGIYQGYGRCFRCNGKGRCNAVPARKAQGHCRDAMGPIDVFFAGGAPNQEIWEDQVARGNVPAISLDQACELAERWHRGEREVAVVRNEHGAIVGLAENF